MRYKILIIITKGEIGGAQQYVLNLAKQLKSESWDVTVGFGCGEFLKDELLKTGINTFRIKWLGRSGNPLTNLLYCFELWKYLRSNDFDTVHFHSSNSLIGAVATKFSGKKTKTAFTFHGLSYLDPGAKKNILIKSFFWIYYKFCLLFIHKVFFVCKANRDYAKRVHLVKDGEIKYPTISIDFLPRESAQKILEEKIGLPLTDKSIIGSIGRLAYPKNYEYFIENFKTISKGKTNAIGIIIGEGPERKKYEKLIKELGMEKIFFLLGEIPNAGRLLKAFDLFVLTSVFEGAPITLLEANAAGLPIISFNTGGIEEIIPDNQITFLKK